jgi:hypothetical protein
MKRRDLVGWICVSVLLGAAVIGGISWLQDREPKPFQRMPQLVMAMRAYAFDLVAKGQRVPDEVPLQTLIEGKYLKAADVEAFKGVEVTFFNNASNKNPQSLLVSVVMTDGQVLCLLADGSVQEVTLARYQQLRAAMKK